MARTEIVKIAWEADISNLVQAVAKEKGLNEKQTRDLLKQLKKRETHAERIAKRMAAKDKRITEQAGKQKIESFRKFGAAAQGSIGSVTSRFLDLGEGIRAFASSVGPIGMAITGFAALGIGGVLAMVGIGAALTKATIAVHNFILSAKDTNDELKKLQEFGLENPIPPQMVKDVEQYSLIWTGIKRTFQEISVAVAGNLAKDLNAVTFEVLVIMRMVQKAGTEWLKVNSIIRESIVIELHKPIFNIIMGLRGMVKHFRVLTKIPGLGKFAGAFDMADDALSALNKGTRAFIGHGVDKFTKKLADTVSRDLGGAYRLARGETASYLLALKVAQKAEEDQAQRTKKSADAKREAAKRAREQAKALRELNAWIKSVTGSTDGLIGAFVGFQEKAENALASPVESINLQLARDLEAFDAARAALKEQEAKIEVSKLMAGDGADTALLDAQLEAVRAKLQEFEQTRVNMVRAASEQIGAIRDEEAAQFEAAFFSATNSIIGAGQALGKFTDAMASQAKDGTESQKRAAMATFAIQQASAIASITISTAQAVAQALASGMPPFNFIQAAAVGAAGAAQLGAVIATPAPTFHTGGAIGGSKMAPDEVGIRAKSGEGVLTGRGMDAIGGRQGLIDANRGASRGPELVIVQKYQHRAFGAFTQDNVRMVNSPIRKAIKGKRKVGHKG